MSDTVPPWLATMRAISGTREYEGGADNPAIIGWRDEIARRFPEMKAYCAEYTHDAIPWCGLTVAYCMAVNGIKPVFGRTATDKFLWAAAWAKFGTRLSNPKPGCVMVFTRNGGGHVALLERIEGDYFVVRGGNQSNAVNEMRMHKSKFTAAVWPDGQPVAQDPAPTHRFKNITATVFGGADDPNQSAYGGMVDPRKPGVALPARFDGHRPKVRVIRGDKSVVCEIVDVGPWNIDDPYWEHVGARPQAESGHDRRGRRTNLAGIDLTPSAAAGIGIGGKGTVDWEFTTGRAPQRTPVTPPAAVGVSVFALIWGWLGAHPTVAIAGAVIAALATITAIEFFKRRD